ncbi:MAG: sugar ABC transporter permease [Nitrospinae bacterium]|nr:sugar ABC transporter permease [Nitrospinota bacterium]
MNTGAVQETARRGSRAWLTPARKQALAPYLLMSPAFAILTGILVYPSLYNIYLSMWKWRLTTPHLSTFVGIDNYVRLLTADPDFWPVTRFSLGFTVATIALEFIIGVASALLLYGLVRGRRLMTSFLLTPYMVAPIAVGLGWRLMWDRDIGIVNYIITFVGLAKVNWLAETDAAFWAIVISEVWRSTPFVTMILLAGITALPNEVFEAAHVDGANRVQVFRRITFPLILPPLVVALLFQTIFKLRVFEIPYILTEGGPGTSTMPYGLLIQRTYFRYFDVGNAAATSVVLLVLGTGIALAYLRLIQDRDG